MKDTAKSRVKEKIMVNNNNLTCCQIIDLLSYFWHLLNFRQAYLLVTECVLVRDGELFLPSLAALWGEYRAFFAHQ